MSEEAMGEMRVEMEKEEALEIGGRTETLAVAHHD